MPVKAKNPTHDSALTINDLKIGRRIIVCSVFAGIMLEGVIVSHPYTKHDPKSYFTRPSLLIDIRSIKNGVVTSHPLAELGVIPWRGHHRWNDRNFVVDHRKRHLLPPAVNVWLGGDDYDEDMAALNMSAQDAFMDEMFYREYYRS